MNKFARLLLVAFIVVLMIFIFHALPFNTNTLEPFAIVNPVMGWPILAIYYMIPSFIGVFVSDIFGLLK
jgi:uncharacterized membrane protein